MASTPRPSRSGSDTRTSAPPTASISTPTWRSRRPRSPRPRHRAPAQAGTGPPTRCSPSWKACEYAALTNTQPAAAQPLADLAPHIRARRIRSPGGLRVPGAVAGSVDGPAAPGVGVLDGAAVLAAPVRPPHGEHDPAGLDRGARGRVRVLRRGAGEAHSGKCGAEHFPGSVPGRVMWPMTVGVQRQGDQPPAAGVTPSFGWRLPETGGGSVETCRSDRRLWTRPPSRAGRFRHL